MPFLEHPINNQPLSTRVRKYSDWHKRTHLYGDMMAKMALRRNGLLFLAAGKADACGCRNGQFDYILLLSVLSFDMGYTPYTNSNEP